LQFERRYDGPEEVLVTLGSIGKSTGRNEVDIDGTFASTSEFSGQATRTKHSISAKLASLAGLSFPTLIVYAFL
jgi:hypothetical protein